MAEELSNPLLELIKEQGMVDDLQYEEGLGELKRSGKPITQILQDFGIMDLDAILHVIANHLGTEVVTLGRELPPDLIKLLPAKVARMYHCLPVSAENSTVKLALTEPLNPGRIDELAFVIKREIQLVVADPVAIDAAIEKYYPEESESVSDILKELGADTGIAREVDEAANDAAAMEALADAAPIVRFVNLVLTQAVADRASDIHFEPFETEF